MSRVLGPYLNRVDRIFSPLNDSSGRAVYAADAMGHDDKTILRSIRENSFLENGIISITCEGSIGSRREQNTHALIRNQRAASLSIMTYIYEIEDNTSSIRSNGLTLGRAR